MDAEALDRGSLSRSDRWRRFLLPGSYNIPGRLEKGPGKYPEPAHSYLRAVDGGCVGIERDTLALIVLKFFNN